MLVLLNSYFILPKNNVNKKQYVAKKAQKKK